MALSTAIKPSNTSVFPTAAVEAKLRDALVETVKSTASLHGVSLPSTISGQCAASVHLDSLGVVEVLCDVEPIVGFELKDSIVKSGGYHSVDEAISLLMPRIESAWHKHQKGAKQ